jgi:hypothetical protein
MGVKNPAIRPKITKLRNYGDSALNSIAVRWRPVGNAVTALIAVEQEWSFKGARDFGFDQSRNTVPSDETTAQTKILQLSLRERELLRNVPGSFHDAFPSLQIRFQKTGKFGRRTVVGRDSILGEQRDHIRQNYGDSAFNFATCASNDQAQAAANAGSQPFREPLAHEKTRQTRPEPDLPG